MPRPALEVADIFRDHDPAWRRAAKGVSGAGHVSLAQLKVMAAIEACRTAALGGHVAACTACGHTHIAYNSCRNRHCPKCQGVAARDWLERRAADLLPVPYYHVVFSRLACYCTVKGIEPAAVDSTTLLGLHAALVAESLSKDPRNLLKHTIAVWNICRRRVPGWPGSPLSSPFKTEPFMIPLEAFPAGFQQDVAAFETRMTNWDLLDDPEPMAKETIYMRVIKRTRELFGVGLNPHAFRSIAATFLAESSPEDALYARPLLGHRQQQTTERYYIRASQIDAARIVSTALRGIRDA